MRLVRLSCETGLRGWGNAMAQPVDLQEILGVAQDAVDAAREIFVREVGAAPALFKGTGDFATAADIAVEELLRDRLTGGTGIEVYGEEQGGELDEQACWVVDPIDGTSNYSTGNPNCAILVSLLVDLQPVAAVVDAPLLNMRLTAVDGAPVHLNGQALPTVGESAVAPHVGVGSLFSRDRRRMPSNQRIELAGELTRVGLRPRISGSVGIDLAFAAQGIYQASVSFSPHVWDNSAGVLLARSAGAVATAGDGTEWAPGKTGAVVGTPHAHAAVMEAMRTVRLEANEEER